MGLEQARFGQRISATTTIPRQRRRQAGGGGRNRTACIM